MHAFSGLFLLWKQADAAARTAEEAVLTQTMKAVDGNANMPSVEDLQEAKRLRAMADKLLDQTIELMRDEDAGRRRPNRSDGSVTDQAPG
jgi:hypothetical protein